MENKKRIDYAFIREERAKLFDQLKKLSQIENAIDAAYDALDRVEKIERHDLWPACDIMLDFSEKCKKLRELTEKYHG